MIKKMCNMFLCLLFMDFNDIYFQRNNAATFKNCSRGYKYDLLHIITPAAYIKALCLVIRFSRGC